MASNFQGGVKETERLRLIKERDELKAALLDIEKHMEDIQENVKTLSAERDHFRTLFKQVGFQSIGGKMYVRIYLFNRVSST